MALVLDRVETPRGELVLRRCIDGAHPRGTGHFEVISNGVFLMDTRNGASERVLITAALARVPKPRDVLVGGLGVGFSLLEALADERVEHVTVVELEPAIIRWHERHLAHITQAAMADERTEVVCADIAQLLRHSEQTYDAICLDVDNGPDWTVTDANAELYGVQGTAMLASRLRPGGVLTVWSAAGSPAYEQVLRRHFGKVEVVEVPVPRGEPDVVFVGVARGRAREEHPVAQTHGRDSDSS